MKSQKVSGHIQKAKFGLFKRIPLRAGGLTGIQVKEIASTKLLGQSSKNVKYC
jgi:hypothetical protein